MMKAYSTKILEKNFNEKKSKLKLFSTLSKTEALKQIKLETELLKTYRVKK